MAKLPNKQFHQLVPLLRDKEFYEPIEQRKISWPEYNLSQIEEAQDTLEFIKNSVDDAKYFVSLGKIGKPLTDPKSLAKAILASEALGLTERNAYEKIEVLFILQQVFEETKENNGILGGDGTGLETSRKQNYEDSKKSGDYMTSIIDSREIVQAFDISGEQECRAMHKLIELVKGESLRLDAGFNDRELVKKIAELNMVPFVFPKKNNLLNGSLVWKEMYVFLLLDVMQWLTEYNQRSHTESFHSSFKRVFGIVTKRRFISKLSQITARIILHNRARISYFTRLNKNL